MKIRAKHLLQKKNKKLKMASPALLKEVHPSLTISLKSTPSMLFNNLTSNSEWIAYISGSEVFAVPDEFFTGKITSKFAMKLNFNEGGMFVNAKFCNQGTSIITAVSEESIQVSTTKLLNFRFLKFLRTKHSSIILLLENLLVQRVLHTSDPKNMAMRFLLGQ
jgi:hypothetical protein